MVVTAEQFQNYRTFANLSKEEKYQFIEGLNDEESLQLKFTWEAWARDKQLEPPGDWWSTWLILAGRGFGKSRTGAEWIRKQVEAGRYGRIAIVGRTAADVRDVMLYGESGLVTNSPPWFMPKHEGTRRRLVWPNGAIATTYSAEEPNSMRGPQHDAAWCLVGHTLVLMSDGTEKPIAEIRVGDYVQTRLGAKRVTGSSLMEKNTKVYLLRTMDGRNLVGTASHKVWETEKGFIPLASFSEGMNVCVTHASNWTATSGINVPAETTTKDASCCTVMFGNKRTEKYQKDIISITEMKIRRITDWKIWNCLHMGNTVLCTIQDWLPIKKKPGLTLRNQWMRISTYVCSVSSLVPIVRRHSIALRPTRLVSVHRPALRLTGQGLSGGRLGCASTAVRNIQLRREHSYTARKSVTGELPHREPDNSWFNQSPVITAKKCLSRREQMLGSAVMVAPKLSTQPIVTVKRLKKTYDVYDITVEDAHEFFANGILVHNCDEICLTAGSHVLTSEGEKPIEGIVPGDLILTRVGFKRATTAGCTSKNSTVSLLQLSTGRSIMGTASHPIWVQGKGFSPLGTLRPGDILIDEQSSEVSCVSVAKLHNKMAVFNLEVEDCHEYFANGILTHNCAWRTSDSLDQLLLGLRLGPHPRVILTTTPRPTKEIKQLVKMSTTYVTNGTTYENRDNLAQMFFDQVIRKFENSRLGRQELLAQLLDDAEGALWKREAMIEQYRVVKAPDLVRVVVGVDPATTSEEDYDENGIVVE